MMDIKRASPHYESAPTIADTTSPLSLIHISLGLLYTEDSNTGRVGSPGAYPNSLAVASADNIGATGGYVCVGEEKYVYNDTASVAFGTLDTSEKGSGTAYDYLFLGEPPSRRTSPYPRGPSDLPGTDSHTRCV